MTQIGFDYSHWSGTIDWSTTRKQPNALFGIGKCTESTYFLDDTWKYNRDKSLELGEPLSAYHFFRNTGNPDAQAAWFIQNLGVKNIPVWCDVETTDTAGTRIEADTKRFMELLKGAGYKVGIYSAPYFLKAWFSTADWLIDYPLWIANYGVTTPAIPYPWNSLGAWGVNPKVVLWQYTDKGTVEGVPELGVDMNYWSPAAGDLYKWFGNGYPYSEPTPPAAGGLRMVVTADRLNVRSGPGVLNPVVGSLASGDIVTATNVKGLDAWVEIAPGKWASARYMTPEGE